jgi:hypothetical protein
MTDPSNPATGEDGAPVDARSGADVAEAIEVAERGSSVREVHDRGTEDKSGAAPVEQVRGDHDMTEGEVVLGEGHATEPPSAGVDPRVAAGSGGAQSQPGARMSDRVAGGEPEPSGPPFDEP